MIGSLMSRMADAQKLSVSQIQQAVQNGSLPAYIGVPLIQDKLKQAQGSAQQPPQQPPIAQKILAEASQLETPRSGMLPTMPTQGVDTLPSNLPTQSMAAGGIVNFAAGDLVDDDEEEDDYGLGSKHNAMLQQMLSESINKNKLLSAIPKSFSSIAQAMPKSYDKAREEAGLPSIRQGTNYVEKPSAPRSVKDIIALKAAEQNLPADLLNRIAGVESGYKATAANPNSTAKGLFQFTNATWKGMGGKEGEQFDPEMNADLGAKYVRQNAEGLKKSLGRNPTYGEVYASHFFGLKGAKDILSMDPRTPMEKAVSKDVLKANPQLQDKTVGDVLSSLTAKTGEGVVSLLGGGLAAAPYYGFAGGGTIKGYSGEDDESLVDLGTLAAASPAVAQGIKTLATAAPKLPAGSLSGVPSALSSTAGSAGRAYLGLAGETALPAAAVGVGGYKLSKSAAKTLAREEMAANRKALQENELLGAMSGDTALASAILDAPQAKTNAALKKTPITDETDAERERNRFASFQKQNKEFADSVNKNTKEEAEKKTGEVAEETKAANPFDEYLKQLAEDRAEAKKQKSINNYMALLQAGLGMMGGTSPYALANIGHGAMAGIQGLAESNKTAAAQKAALDKAQVAAMHYKDYGELQRANQLTKEERMGIARQKEIAMARDDYAQYQKNLSEEFLKNNPMAAISPDDPKVVAARNAFYAKHAPILESLKKAAYPNLPEMAGSNPNFAGFSIKR